MVGGPKAPKAGRPTARPRKRGIEGRPWTRRKVEISLYIDEDLLALCNKAFLQSPHRYFSRWASEKLKEALK